MLFFRNLLPPGCMAKGPFLKHKASLILLWTQPTPVFSENSVLSGPLTLPFKTH